MTINKGEIDAIGQVHSLESLIRLPPGRSLLTLLDDQANEPALLAETSLAKDRDAATTGDTP